MKMHVEIVELFGGSAALQTRVDAFKKALEDHRFTVDIPAPTEHDVVEALARGGGTVEPFDPRPLPIDGPEAESEAAARGLVRHALVRAANSTVVEIIALDPATAETMAFRPPGGFQLVRVVEAERKRAVLGARYDRSHRTFEPPAPVAPRPTGDSILRAVLVSKGIVITDADWEAAEATLMADRPVRSGGAGLAR